MKKKILQLCLALVLGLTVSFAVVGCNPTTPEIKVSGVQRVFDLGSSFSLGQNAVVNKVQDGKTTALKSGEYTVTQNFDGQKQGVYTVTVTLQKDVSYAYDVAVVDLDGFSAKEGQVLSEIALPFSQLAWKTPSTSVGSKGVNTHAVVFNPAKGGSAEFNVKIAVSSVSTAKQNAWTVVPSIDGWTYGEAPKAPVGEAKYGTVVFEYYSDENLSADSKLDGVPANAGTYWLVAKVAEGESYTGLVSDPVQFVIAKATNSWTVVPAIESWTYGEAAKVPAGKAQFGTVVFEYYSDESLSADSKLDGVPANAGTYWLVATVAAGENYNSLTSAAVDFTVAKANNSWTTQPSIEGWTYGEAPKDSVGSAKYGTVVFEYYSDESLSAESKLDGVPANAGTYWLVAKVAEGEDYTSLTSSVEFVIAKATNSWTVVPAIESWTYGERAKAPVGAAKYDEVVFEYYSDESLSMGSKLEGVPSDAGTYWMLARVEGTENVNEFVSEKISFTITVANIFEQTKPTATDVYAGSKLKESEIHGGSFYYNRENASGIMEKVEVSGSWIWVKPETVVNEQGNFAALFKPNDKNLNPSVVNITVGIVAEDGISASVYIVEFDKNFPMTRTNNEFVAEVPLGEISTVTVNLNVPSGVSVLRYRIMVNSSWYKWNEFVGSQEQPSIDTYFAFNDVKENTKVQVEITGQEFFGRYLTFEVRREVPIALEINGEEKPFDTILKLGDEVLVTAKDGYVISASSTDGIQPNAVYTIKESDLNRNFSFNVERDSRVCGTVSVTTASVVDKMEIGGAQIDISNGSGQWKYIDYEYSGQMQEFHVSFTLNPAVTGSFFVSWRTNLSDNYYRSGDLDLYIPNFNGLNFISFSLVDVNTNRSVVYFNVKFVKKSVVKGFTYASDNYGGSCTYEREEGLVYGLFFDNNLALNVEYADDNPNYEAIWLDEEGLPFDFTDLEMKNKVTLSIMLGGDLVDSLNLTLIFVSPFQVIDNNGKIVYGNYGNNNGRDSKNIVMVDNADGPFVVSSDHTLTLVDASDGGTVPDNTVTLGADEIQRTYNFTVVNASGQSISGEVTFIRSTGKSEDLIQEIIIYNSLFDKENNGGYYSLNAMDDKLYIDVYFGRSMENFASCMKVVVSQNYTYTLDVDEENGIIIIEVINSNNDTVLRYPVIANFVGSKNNEIHVDVFKKSMFSEIYENYDITWGEMSVTVKSTQMLYFVPSNGGVRIQIEKDGNIIWDDYSCFTIGGNTLQIFGESGLYNITFTSSDKSTSKSINLNLTFVEESLFTIVDKNGVSYDLNIDMTSSDNWEFNPAFGMARFPASMVDETGATVQLTFNSSIMTMEVNGQIIQTGEPVSYTLSTSPEGYKYFTASFYPTSAPEQAFEFQIVFNL